MNKDKYIIINKEEIEKRIENCNKRLSFVNERHDMPIQKEIDVLQSILYQYKLIPLIPEIEKAFLAGRSVDNIDSIDDIKPTYSQFEDYIANLELDI